MFSRPHWRVVLAVVLLGLMAAEARTQTAWVGVCTEVLDGDTLTVGRGDQRVTVDLEGIDAPELGQPFGPAARRMLVELAADRQVRVRPAASSAADSLQARVVVDGTDLGKALVDAGLAWHDARHSSDEVLVVAMIQARSAGLGLWADPDPQAPWLYEEPADPTPTPVRRTISDVAGQVELQKGADGKAVISDPDLLPAREADGRGSRASGHGGSAGPGAGGPGTATCCCKLWTRDVGDDGAVDETINYERLDSYSCEHGLAVFNQQTGIMQIPDGCVSDAGCR